MNAEYFSVNKSDLKEKDAYHVGCLGVFDIVADLYFAEKLRESKWWGGSLGKILRIKALLL